MSRQLSARTVDQRFKEQEMRLAEKRRLEKLKEREIG